MEYALEDLARPLAQESEPGQRRKRYRSKVRRTLKTKLVMSGK
jgi:hypothetical protein